MRGALGSRCARIGAIASALGALMIGVAPAGAAEAPIAFREGTVSYAPPAYDPGIAVLTGDFNHDGLTDVAMLSGEGQGRGGCNSAEGCLSVLLGEGEGRFAVSPLEADAEAGLEALPDSPAKSYPLGGQPSFGEPDALAAGQLTGSGSSDLVVALSSWAHEEAGSSCSASEGCVVILYGGPEGSFSGPVPLPREGMEGTPQAVAVGKLTESGREDIAVAAIHYQGLESAAHVYIYENEGDKEGHAVFKLVQAIALAGPIERISGMTLANLTGSGERDLAISTERFYGSGTGACAKQDCVQTLIDKSGRYSEPATYPVEGAGQITAAHLTTAGTRDGVLVPITSAVPPPRGEEGERYEYGFAVLLNEGEGKLAPPVAYHYPQTPALFSSPSPALAVGAFAANGKLDVALGNPLGGALELFAGNGEGRFTYAGSVGGEGSRVGNVQALATGAFTSNCKLDLVSSGGGRPIQPEVLARARPAIEAAAGPSPGGALVLFNVSGGEGSACPPPPPPPTTTTTTTTTASSPASTTTLTSSTTTGTSTSTPPAPRIAVKGRRVVRLALRPALGLVGLPRTCTRTGLHLRVRLTLGPRSLLERLRRLHGSARLRTVIRVSAHRVATRKGARFTVTVPASDFGIGRNRVQLAVSMSGKHLVSRERTFVRRFSRCGAQPLFTG